MSCVFIASGRGPFQCAHAAHGAANDQGPAVEARRVGHVRFRRALVTPCQPGEGAAPSASVEARGGGAGAALAAAPHVRGDDEPGVRVEGQAGPHEAVPPARRGVPRPGGSRDMTVTGECVQYERHVGTVRREPPHGLELPGERLAVRPPPPAAAAAPGRATGAAREGPPPARPWRRAGEGPRRPKRCSGCAPGRADRPLQAGAPGGSGGPTGLIGRSSQPSVRRA